MGSVDKEPLEWAINLSKRSHRVGTGSYQFPHDWPGVFIRGDEAVAMAERLQHLHSLDFDKPDTAVIVKAVIKEAMRLLDSCNVSHETLSHD